MSEPLVCQLLRHGGVSLAEVIDRWTLLSKRNLKYPNLVLLKYHQINSDIGDPLVQECRGLILDEADNWKVISRPFDKFFNADEGKAAKIDWSTARVQEKVDGSLCTLYYYDSNWHVSTSGTPDASGRVDGALDGTTFADLFWRTFNLMGYGRPLNTGLCYMFELTSPLNRIVVDHRRDRLTLLGARRLFDDQTECPVDWIAALTGYDAVWAYPLQTLDEIIATFKTMDPLHQEGYVVVDADFNRIKCKHPGYVAIHHVRGEGGFSDRRLFRIALTGEGSEVVSYYPETGPKLADYRSRIEAVKARIDFDRIALSPLAQSRDRKAFAAEALKTTLPTAQFRFYDGKAKDAAEVIASMREDDVAALCGLGLKKEEEP